MNTLLYIILATGLVSLGSLIGVFTISLNRRVIQKFLLNLVALSAGTLLAGAFVHLLPESIEILGSSLPLTITLFSFVGFFIIEKLLRWRHCHDEAHCEEHTTGYMNLFGDVIHNILDGIVIAGAFITDVQLGYATTLAIMLHEIPQEIGDFGVLLHSGFRRSKALFFNFVVGLSAVIGGILGFYATATINGFTPHLLAIASGGFIYIAATDLVPEMHKTTTNKRTISLVITFFIGVGLMYLIRD